MGRAAFLASLALLMSATAGVPAADLQKTDRTLRKEPPYKSRPSYCLLLFGPDAAVGVWVVLDGDDVYIDRNADGDLTNDGPPVSARLAQVGEFKPFEVTDKASGSRYRVQGLSVHQRAERDLPVLSVRVEVAGKYEQYSSATLAGDRDKAPLSHFGGPLRLVVGRGTPRALVAGPAPTDLFVLIGTIDEAAGCWVVVRSEAPVRDRRRGIPADLHPVAEVEYLPDRPGATSVRERYALAERC
jgi:hypothetical protein